ncbi:phosphopantetheine-binding protein [Paraburkholderia sp.]|jgi:acyl carrier protein|uniref:phosphopantetheine-binding protein n=1 Tax=Paraburkholderia sp. TaxID=1926495 RepID=UPI002F3E5D44
MGSQNVPARVTQCTVEQITSSIPEGDPSKVTPSAQLVEDLMFDNLDLVELRGLLETEFGIQIDDAAMRSVVTVGDWITYCQANGVT